MYLLDTNICIYAMKGTYPKLNSMLLRVRPELKRSDPPSAHAVILKTHTASPYLFGRHRLAFVLNLLIRFLLTYDWAIIRAARKPPLQINGRVLPAYALSATKIL